MSRSESLFERVHSSQIALVRRLNDHHIFAAQAVGVLSEARAAYSASAVARKRQYFVPAHSRKGIARRTDADLRKIYDTFVSRDLFSNFIVVNVSLAEAFLFDTLREVLKTFPKKLSMTPKGEDGEREIPLKAVLEAKSLTGVIDAVIARRVQSLSFAAPREYLRYFQDATGVDTSGPIFAAYIEVKATRDVLVHNSGRANDIYLQKAGRLSRAKVGRVLLVNREYFDHSIATLKKLANLVDSGITAVFGPGRMRDVTA